MTPRRKYQLYIK